MYSTDGGILLAPFYCISGLLLLERRSHGVCIFKRDWVICRKTPHTYPACTFSFRLIGIWGREIYHTQLNIMTILTWTTSAVHVFPKDGTSCYVWRNTCLRPIEFDSHISKSSYTKIVIVRARDSGYHKQRAAIRFTEANSSNTGSLIRHIWFHSYQLHQQLACIYRDWLHTCIQSTSQWNYC